MDIGSFVPLVLALAAAPLLLRVINRTKAIVAGRVGQPLLQVYYDLRKLLGKGAVYSRTTTWVFRAGPIISLAAVLLAVAIVPFGSWGGAIRFPGDLVLFVYLLGLARVFTVLAALDTGSSFEGMGASREVLYSALAEPALLLGLAAIARQTRSLSLSEMHQGLGSLWATSGLAPVLVAVALIVVLLAENSRIPVDDPNTHLELTMIHEVMVLDHGGPDLAFITYGAALKLWVLGVLSVDMLWPPRSGIVLVDTALALAGMFGLAVLVGVVESTMARLRLTRVPQLLIGATLTSALALVVVYGEATS
jgi:formate hydrogenlyase subunit 4